MRAYDLNSLNTDWLHTRRWSLCQNQQIFKCYEWHASAILNQYLINTNKMQNQTNDRVRMKRGKQEQILNGIATPKNISRKKTHSNKDKSHNKKTRKTPQQSTKISGKSDDSETEKPINYKCQQYYANDNFADQHRSFSEYPSDYEFLKNKSEYDNSISYSNINEAYNQYGSSPKIKLAQMKEVISFDGKMVKNTRKQGGQNYAKWQMSSQDFTTQLKTDRKQRQSKSRKKQGKSKSKGKYQKSQGKSRIIHNIPQFHPRKQRQQSSANLKFNSKPQTAHPTKYSESVETLSTPNLQHYERNENIDFQFVKVELASQLKWHESNKNSILVMKKNLYEQRCSCINMLSKICGAMQYKKQTFGLTVHVFDNFLSDQVLFRKTKILALSCLQIALKLQQAENAYNFIRSLSELCVKAQKPQMLPRNQSQNMLQKKESRNKTRQKSQQRKKTKKKMTEDLKTVEFLKKQKILLNIISQQIPDEQLSRAEMVDFQILILFKFQFKLCNRTFAYWFDILTLIWDHFLLNDNEFYTSVDSILFRCPSSPRNFSLLVQIIESCLYSQRVYEYPKTILVLSVIYMIVRINMEGSESGFEIYRKTLSKSSNILFIDRVGCNVLFGTFLLTLEIQMGTILSCCQFISTYLDIEPYQMFTYGKKQIQKDSYDEKLSYHIHNKKIYQHYCK